MATAFNQLGTTANVLTDSDLSGVATAAAQAAAKAVVDDTNTKVTSIKSTVEALAAKYCSIVVTVATQDDVTVTGQTVTLRAGSTADAAIYDTRPYNGQPVTFEVPKDFRYFAEVSSTLTGHFAPTTAQGTATTATTAVTLTYSDISHITTYADIKGAMDSIQTQAEGRAALVGIEIADTWTSDDGITVYNDPMICVDVQPVEDATNATHLAAIMMKKYTTKNDIQFDAAENGVEAYSTEATAKGGIFYWGYAKDYAQATTYAVNAFCSYKGGVWKCVTAVTGAESFDADKWSLLDAKLYDATAEYAVGDYAKYGGKVYECQTAIASGGEAWNTEHWEQKVASAAFQASALTHLNLASGATVPYSAWLVVYKTDISSSNKDYMTSGYNNWELSAWRQYLNSDEPAGQWWYSQHTGDCPPSQHATVRGWKAGISAALLQYAKPIKVPCYPWNYGPQKVVDQFWLASGSEMYGAANENEGYALKKVIDNCNTISGWTSASNNSTNARVYRRVSATGSAVYVWLRSAYRGSSYFVWIVTSNGYINPNYTAVNSFAGVPACAIF